VIVERHSRSVPARMPQMFVGELSHQGFYRFT
jgi:hypothetical protein